MAHEVRPPSVFVSDKGFAVLAAIDAGLLPKTEDGGHDTEAFERFWSLYRKRAAQYGGTPLQQAQNQVDKLTEMLNHEREQRAEDRRYYLTTQRRTIFATSLGFLIGKALSLLI